MKIIIHILNIIAALPILLYPFALLGSIFTVGVSREITWLLWFYPIPVIVLILLSYKYESVLLALIAALLPVAWCRE